VAVEHEKIVPIHNSRGEFLENPLVAVSDLIRANTTDLIVTEFKTGSRAYSTSGIQTSRLKSKAWTLALEMAC
jgi:hypothetical protein